MHHNIDLKAGTLGITKDIREKGFILYSNGKKILEMKLLQDKNVIAMISRVL
jgi:hypothetical protein